MAPETMPSGDRLHAEIGHHAMPMRQVGTKARRVAHERAGGQLQRLCSAMTT